jgi:DNA-binding response OmpR family regulator
VEEISRRSDADRRTGVRVGLLADPPDQHHPALSVIENLGWESVALTTWPPPIEEDSGALELLILSVDRVSRASLATISDAALNPQLNILVVSKGRNPQTIADVLRCGAHDYLARPFAPLELEARMVALVTRVWPTSDRRSQNGISFDFVSRTAVTGPYVVAFTALEWDVLIALLERDGQPMTTGQVIDELSHRALKSSSITAVVSRIRHKLERYDFRALTIDTVQGRGYVARFRRASDQWTRATGSQESDGRDKRAHPGAELTRHVQDPYFDVNSLLR